MKILIAAAAILAIGALPARAPHLAVRVEAARAPDVDPVGRYELQATMRNAPASLVARIERLEDGSLGGELAGNSINAVHIVDVRVADSTVRFSVFATETVKADFRMVLSGDRVTGEWSMPGDGSPITGRRVH